MSDAPESSDLQISLNETIVAVWAKTVDTQMHFNEMSVKSRQLGLTFVAAALALAVFLFQRNSADTKYSIEIAICGYKIFIQVAEFIVIAAAAAVYAVRVLDLGVYHKMLRGAVAFGEDLEENYLKKIFDLNKGMTQSISHFSRHSDAAVSGQGSKYTYTGTNKKSAHEKISRFYTLVISALLAVAVLMFAIDNVSRVQ